MNNTRTSARNVGRIPVEDIMATEVVYVGPRDTVREALELMLQNHVSAVPVVEGRGRCIGVLSTTDIVNLAQELDEDLMALGRTKGFAHQLMIERLAESDMATERVQAVMTEGVIRVGPGDTVARAAAEMVRHHVHRVIVTDEEQRLVGIVSAMDVLRALAEANN
jgi:CBS-domain-containing membrane protein